VLEINMTHGNLEAWAGEVLAANGAVAQIDKRLTSIEVPVVVIQGDGDRLVHPIHGRELAAALPNSRLVMVRGGHMQPYDHPAAIAVAVQSLSGTSPKGRSPKASPTAKAASRSAGRG
jgi:pimeloyl-ACP methyl ester carboxylesterase